jgi:hypothetical protein
LRKAYAYYEHVTLPRHFVGEQTASHVLRRSEPGETQETELYSPFRTRGSIFIEWGIGVDLYFSTLRIMAIVLFVAGLVHIPNLIFFRSDEYSPAGKGPDNGLPWSLYGSAVCTTREWVACTNCTAKDWNSTTIERQRFGVNTADGTILVERSACNVDSLLKQGLVNWVTLLMLTGVLIFLAMYLGAREVRFDEDKITATDCKCRCNTAFRISFSSSASTDTIVVNNPPPDAYEPDQWRDFFAQFAEKQ